MSAPCCPPGSHGRVDPPADYVEKGSVVPLAKDGLQCECYVVQPEPDSSNGKSILMLHDIFGWNSGRTKVIADLYAAAGYVVVLPNLVRKGLYEDIATPGWRQILGLPSLIYWVRENAWSNNVGPYLNKLVLPYLREELAATSIGIVNFCWGCYPTMKLLAQQEPDIKAAVGMHPSLKIFLLFPWDSPSKLMKKVQVPTMWLAGGNDPGDIKAGGWADKLLAKKPELYKDTVFRTFAKMKHGWVNRGDLGEDDVCADYKTAINLSKDFFESHL